MGEVERIFMNKRTGELKHRCFPGFGMQTNLVYDVNTKIIYYKELDKHNEYMCPYISENGKYCRFIDDKIVEVN